MSDDRYCYPGSTTLRNRFGVIDPHQLEEVERSAVSQRLSEGAPHGRFDLKHLRAMHRHLFQDVYDWAGELREVEISKGDTQFMLRRFIGRGMEDVHQRIERARGLRGMTVEQFAQRAGEIIGDVNHVHPFREGNGRTQLEYLRQLAERAGHRFDVQRLDAARWHEASRTADKADYAPMAEEIRLALPER